MILNIYKPIGLTSFGVVKAVKKITKEKKVGHGGTLDPFAEGVLIIGTGKDTKKLSEITNLDKSYVALLNLGSETDTLDIEGQIIETARIPVITEKIIEETLKSFEGFSMQIPPMYSAKRINGKRLYKLARKNITVKREPAKIHIHEIKILDYSLDQISFKVTCTKGTYIRVLGSDIAKKLGTLGYLEALKRTSIGNYSVDDSTTIDNFRLSWK
tara:strand:- start:4525 stop:5166 length:642 start_codon:yes stop_codon:yes gene_type:complete